ncbi:MAG TPA: hypothetical protein VFR08_15105 [Candidatus Angelobacter sp.]|nr:hypothetical protein [Candidatus Angelobacter sp.]
MSARRALRTKAVLPVTVFRNYGAQRQVAHTLDATENSARLGAIHIPIEPGEIIEIQRGAFRAKFQVFWVGAPSGLLAGQAGVRLVTGGKSIWGTDFPKDRPDLHCEPQNLRSGLPLVSTIHPAFPLQAAEQKFKGGASIRAAGCSHAIYGHIAEICETGVYLQTPSVLPVNTEAYVLLNLQGFVVEIFGSVRASDLQGGMQIDFQKMSPAAREKLFMALRSLEEPELDLTEELDGGPRPAASVRLIAF